VILQQNTLAEALISCTENFNSLDPAHLIILLVAQVMLEAAIGNLFISIASPI
jgi:hypothetical protein